MDIRHLKHDIVKKLFDRGIYTRQVNDIQYVTRCPYCGDSPSNQNTGHFYIRINPNDNFNIVYNCFKCPASGILTYETLEYLDIGDDPNLKQMVTNMNKNAQKFDSKNYSNDELVDSNYNFEIPEIKKTNKIKYLTDRLDIKLDNDDIINLRIVSSFREFLLHNKISKITCKPNMARLFERDYIGFLTSRGSHIIFRDVTEQHKIRWFKYKIMADERNDVCFYSIDTSLDILTDETIFINMSEGIFDIVSVKHNIGFDNDNTLNIAMLGKNHITILNYLIRIGIAGSNVIVNIFSDADHRYDKKKYDTTIHYYNKILNKYKYIFGEVNIFYNMLDNDVGVPKDEIKLEKHRL